MFLGKIKLLKFFCVGLYGVIWELDICLKLIMVFIIRFLLNFRCLIVDIFYKLNYIEYKVIDFLLL